MVRKLDTLCERLALDDDGRNAYLAEVNASGAGLGSNADELGGDAPTGTELAPYYEAFLERHGGAVFSSQAVFCKAGEFELDEGTGIGRMLRRTEN